MGSTGDRASNARPAVLQLVQLQIKVMIEGSIASRHTDPHAHTIAVIVGRHCEILSIHWSKEWHFELLLVWWTLSLARGGDPLELYRADVADGRVASLRVVEEFDVIEHVGTGLITRAVYLAGCALGF
jgi:hypothetical protein